MHVGAEGSPMYSFLLLLSVRPSVSTNPVANASFVGKTVIVDVTPNAAAIQLLIIYNTKPLFCFFVFFQAKASSFTSWYIGVKDHLI